MTLYDPYQQTHCGGAEFAPSYWASTTELPTAITHGDSNKSYDVAIIGGGFSGLLTAYYLATEHNITACVVEANQVGFGASARNAGFVLKGSGRLSYQQIAKKWGLDVCRGIFDEHTQAVDRVEQLITQHQIDCEPQQKGYLKIAHNEKAYTSLQSQAEFLTKHLAFNGSFISQQALRNDYMHNQQAYGALRMHDSFGVNPLKLLLGYRQAVLDAGVHLYEKTPVLNVSEQNGQQRLVTPTGHINVNKVIYCGNAYNNKQSSQAIDSRYLPILSSIIVTRPLSSEEIEALALKTTQVTMDTRILKYYYRLLPDNRLLFGGRGAVFAKHQYKEKYKTNLKRALADCFPLLATIKIDYFWSGYIAAALDDMPHINFDGQQGFILGYCGAGVSFSAQAAYRLAQMVNDKPVPDLPLFNRPLPHIPLPWLRRYGQLAYYQYAQIKDRFW